jgi:WD40 repeat protein
MLLNSHAEQVMTLTAAPTGQMLATADSDHDIHIWGDPATAKVHHVLRGHVEEVRTLAFSPDGTKLASAGADRVIHVWDVATGQLLAGPNPSGRHAIAAFRSGGKLLLASTGGPVFRLWDADAGAEVAPSGDGPAYSTAASADGRWLAVGGTDHFTRLYDLTAPGTAPKRLEATKPPIGLLAVHPKGELVAHTSPADGLVWLWNPATGEPLLILIEAADGCTLEGVAFHPDGNRVAVGGIDYLSTGERDGAVCVWDLSTKEKVLTLDTGVYAVTFDPLGRYLAGAALTDRVVVWDATTGDVVFELDGHQERINAVAFSPDGSYLVSGGDDMTVRVWDVLSGRLLIVRAFDAPVQAVAFSPDGSAVFTGNGNTTCYRVEFRKLLEE